MSGGKISVVWTPQWCHRYNWVFWARWKSVMKLSAKVFWKQPRTTPLTCVSIWWLGLRVEKVRQCKKSNVLETVLWINSRWSKHRVVHLWIEMVRLRNGWLAIPLNHIESKFVVICCLVFYSKCTVRFFWPGLLSAQKAVSKVMEQAKPAIRSLLFPWGLGSAWRALLIHTIKQCKHIHIDTC